MAGRRSPDFATLRTEAPEPIYNGCRSTDATMATRDNGSDSDKPPPPLGGGDQGTGDFVYELRGSTPLDEAQRAALKGFVVTHRTGAAPLADGALRVLSRLGEGAAVVEPTGEITWMNEGLSGQTPEIMRRFADCCVEIIASWARTRQPVPSRQSFRVGMRWFEVVASPIEPLAGGGRGTSDPVRPGAAGLLLDVTASRSIRDRLDAIDQAGAALLAIDAESMRGLHAPERLRNLEGKVIAATRSLLGFDHFEYRLTNRRSSQLELVFCSGLVPLGIGERIYARSDGNGLSGVVAVTGQAIVCRDVASEPRYVGGLPGAKSTLTVPLRLHDKVIGVLNAESPELHRFDDEDRLCAELLGRYVALALNILDMLVAERCDTAKTMLANLSEEAAGPLAELNEDALSVLSRGGPAFAAESARIKANAARIEELLHNAAAGPSGILGADEFMREGFQDPVFKGKRVLVADDEDAIRETIQAVLAQQGCEVHEYRDGARAIAAIRAAAAAGKPFDLVVSDVRMPDANGYEVFRATKDSSAATPVILMTAFGYDPNHSIVRSSQEGLHCFLFKPFQVAQLLEEGRKALLGA
jgi:CheY-like chemotaxis protein